MEECRGGQYCRELRRGSKRGRGVREVLESVLETSPATSTSTSIVSTSAVPASSLGLVELVAVSAEADRLAEAGAQQLAQLSPLERQQQREWEQASGTRGAKRRKGGWLKSRWFISYYEAGWKSIGTTPNLTTLYFAGCCQTSTIASWSVPLKSWMGPVLQVHTLG